MHLDITTNKIFNEKITIKQHKKGYRFSIDSAILADFVYEEEEKSYLEIGTGSGIMSILLSIFDTRKPNMKKSYAVELQEGLYQLAKENFILNGVKNIELLHQDIKTIKKTLKPSLVDIVFSNPPFFPLATGRVNPNNEKYIARHEVCLTLKDILKVANYLLKPKGKLKLIYPVERLTHITQELTDASFGLSILCPIYPKKGESARLLLVEAIKGGKKVETKMLPPIYINKNDQFYSDYVNQIIDL